MTKMPHRRAALRDATPTSRAATLSRVLSEEMWRAERTVHRFRTSIWCGLGLAAFAVFEHEGVQSLQPLVCLAWGLVCFVIGRLWLADRSRFRRYLPYILTTTDVLVLGLSVQLALSAPELSEVDRTRQVYSLGFGLLLIMAGNVLRLSWRSSLWVTLCCLTTFLVVLGRSVGMTIYNAIDALIFVSMGAILVYSGEKLRRVLYRVQQRNAFARFLPAPVVQRLSHDPTAVSLGGEELEATVLFADMRGFTTLAERLPPVAVVNLLNEYFSVMVDEVLSSGGILDKFIGDGLCAVFGPPETPAEQARTAVACAERMLKRLDELNETRASRGEAPLRMGIGIHTGRLIAGNIGSPMRLEYTHVGDTVNMANRIEGLTKLFGAELLISEATYAVGGGFPGLETERKGPVILRGKAESVHVWAVHTRRARVKNDVA